MRMDDMNNKLNGIQMEVTGEYTKFVEKFKPKKTTDDCYTPPNIYETVKTWTVKRYGLENSKIIRPFYPGGDYTREDYPDDCVVIDNPPFSIVTNIQRFYNDRGIRYFLFAPALTLFSGGTNSNYVIAGATITYANGAKVNTSFVTNLGEFKILVAPDLYQAIKQADGEKNAQYAKQLPKYEYPVHVASAARLNYLAVHGASLAIKAENVAFVRKLDAQGNKTIFGGGFLLSEKAAAEKATAEKAAAEKATAEKAAVIRYELSEREKTIIKILTERDDTC